MKKAERFLAVVLSVVLLIGTLPLAGFADLNLFSFAFSAKAAVSNYSAAAAAAWANDHWNDTYSMIQADGYFYEGGDCANFVSQCMYMGGIDMTRMWHENKYWRIDASSDFTYIRADQLYHYAVSLGGQSIQNPSEDQVEIGDLVFYNTNYSGRLDHSAIVCAKENGVPVIAAHSTYDSAGNPIKYRTSNWRLNYQGRGVYLVKMFGTLCNVPNRRSFDVYSARNSSPLRSSPTTGSTNLRTIQHGDWIHVYEVKNAEGYRWGYTNYKGYFGWTNLGNFTYLTHADSIIASHDFGAWFREKQPTCTEDGLDKRICRRCGYTEAKTILALGHRNIVPATCTSHGYCSICGAVLQPALGHDWGEWVITDPTCIKDGVEKHTCNRCGLLESFILPALGHDYKVVLNSPTCTVSGNSEYQCSRCGNYYTSNNDWSDWVDLNSQNAETKAHMQAIINTNDVQKLYEKKTQYHYREKIRTTSNSSSLPGYELEKTTYDMSGWSNWSSWQDEAISEGYDGSELVKQVESQSNHVGYYMEYWLYTDSSALAKRGYYATEQSSGTLRYHQEPVAIPDSMLSGTEVGPGQNSPSGNNGSGTNRTSQTGYFIPQGGTGGLDGATNAIHFKSGEWKKTQYHYRTRYKIYTYHFWKWGAWSAWQDNAISGNNDKQVETRTVYRFRQSALGHNFQLKQEIPASNGNCVLKEYECTRCHLSYTIGGHKWSDWAVTDPDCIHDGAKVRTCSICGTTETEVIPALGHAWDADPDDVDTWEIVQEATCTQKEIRVLHCVRDSAHDRTEEKPPRGHQIVTLEGYPATCLEDGLTDGSYCSECGEVFVEQDVIEALDHDWGEWFETKAPSCGDNGVEERICNRDPSHHETREIETPYPDHSWVISETYDEPCSYNPETGAHMFGYKYNIYTCETCGKRDDTPKDVEQIPHQFPLDSHGEIQYTVVKEPTCTEEGLSRATCTVCGYPLEEVLDPLGHDWGDPYTVSGDPCLDPSTTYHDCKRGDVTGEPIEEIPAAGHDWDADPDDEETWEITKQPTCTEPGERTLHCAKNSAHNRTVPVTVIDHDYQKTDTIPPTCLEPGYDVYTCSMCGDTYQEITEQPTGHDWGDWHDDDVYGVTHSRICRNDPSHVETHTYGPWIDDENGTTHTKTCINEFAHTKTQEHDGHWSQWETVKEPSYTAPGIEKRTCLQCGYEETRELPQLVKYHARFWSDEDKTTLIADVIFEKGQTSIDEPDVPQRERYDASWQPYTLDDHDIDIFPDYKFQDADYIEKDKTAVFDPESGVATIRLRAESDAEELRSVSSRGVPIDFVLVLDQSGSMADNGRLQALKNATTALLQKISQDASEKNLDHRVAAVGFAMGDADISSTYPAYLNTEMLSAGTGRIQYDNIRPDDYANALQPIHNTNGQLNTILAGVPAKLAAKGATAAELGLTMANNIFANIPVSGERKRVVLFMTDGEPNHSNGFNPTVADMAIQQALQLKSLYHADVYSVGVEVGTGANVNNFLQYVSSKYTKAISMSVNGGNPNAEKEYYISASNAAKQLESIFTSIVEESTTFLTPFKNITLIDTISPYFTLTTKQEQTLRENAIADLGIENGSISVTRNDDGTTTVVLRNIDPKIVPNGDKAKSVINFSFEVSANETALLRGFYPTNTDEAGIKLGDNELYEAKFPVPSVEIKTERSVAIFRINGDVYDIQDVKFGDEIVAPEVDFDPSMHFSGWDVPEGKTLSGGSVIYDAMLVDGKHSITWIGESETITEEYFTGDPVQVPLFHPVNGKVISGYTPAVPTVMPDEDLTIRLQYKEHNHHWKGEVIQAATCLQGGLNRYTCDLCGESYDEQTSVDADAHDWLALMSSAEEKDRELAFKSLAYEEFRCQNCGAFKAEKLRYMIVKETYNPNDKSGVNRQELSIDMIDSNNENVEQPDGTVRIRVERPASMRNATDIYVIRINADGSETRLKTSFTNSYITFYTDHFCTFYIVAEYPCLSLSERHEDKNFDRICDNCLCNIKNIENYRCKMCDTYDKYKDVPIVGWFVSFIHSFVHSGHWISFLT